ASGHPSPLRTVAPANGGRVVPRALGGALDGRGAQRPRVLRMTTTQTERAGRGARLALFFTPSRVGGGVGRSFVTLAGALAARGYEVDLVLSRGVGPYLREVPPGVNLVVLRKGRVANDTRRASRSASSVTDRLV